MRCWFLALAVCLLIVTGLIAPRLAHREPQVLVEWGHCYERAGGFSTKGRVTNLTNQPLRDFRFSATAPRAYDEHGHALSAGAPQSARASWWQGNDSAYIADQPVSIPPRGTAYFLMMTQTRLIPPPLPIRAEIQNGEPVLVAQAVLPDSVSTPGY